MVLRRGELRTLERVFGLVIPEPVLAGLEAPDDRMPGLLGVRRRVLRRRAITASDVAALGAPAQVEPPAAGGVAFDAARPARRHRRVDARDLCHSALLPRGDRKPYPEPGIARDRLYGNIAVVLVHHDAPGDVEPEPGSLAHGLGGEERLEDPIPDLRRYPRPGIAELHEHELPVQPRADGQGPRPPHSRHRVIDQ